ncbi:MAG: hypothetical protein WC627_07785 [Legionella sp.]
MMKYAGLALLLLFITACSGHKVKSAQVFSNAQIMYQEKDNNAVAKKTALQMPSYFLDIEYNPKQTKLSTAQAKKIDSVFAKLIYPEEYRLYASFGANTNSTHLANLGPIFKRAEDLKKRYGKQVKEIKVVYLKNQKPDCVYLRLLG